MASANSLWSGSLTVENSEIRVTINFQENSKRNHSTFNWGSDTSTVQLKRYAKSSLKASSSGGQKINLNKYLKNSQVVCLSCEVGEGIDLVSYLRGGGTETGIGYLKPEREDLTPVILVVTEVNNQLKIFGFCVDIPLDQAHHSPSDRKLIFSTFHTLLIGRVGQEQEDRITKDNQIKSEHHGRKEERRDMKKHQRTDSTSCPSVKKESDVTEQLFCDNDNTWDNEIGKRDDEEYDEEYENENEFADYDQLSYGMNGDEQGTQDHGNYDISDRQLADIIDPRTAAGAEEKVQKLTELQKVNPNEGNCLFCFTEKKTIYHLRQSAECRDNYEAWYGPQYKLEIQTILYKQTRVKKRVGKVVGPSVCEFCPAPADKLLLVHLRNSRQCSIKYQEQYSQNTEEDMRKEIKKEKARMRKRKQRQMKS